MKINYLNKNASANQFLWSRIVQAIKRIRGIFVIFLINLALLGGFNPLSKAAQESSIEFEGQIMSAELQGVSLRVILEKLKKEKGIWVKGNESLLDENISVKFKNLSINEGVNRILSNINHALFFDQGNRLVGVVFVSNKKTTNNTYRIAENENKSSGNSNSPGWGNNFGDFADKGSHTPFSIEEPSLFKTDKTKHKKESKRAQQKNAAPEDTLFKQNFTPDENPFGESLENQFADPFKDQFKGFSSHEKK